MGGSHNDRRRSAFHLSRVVFAESTLCHLCEGTFRSPRAEPQDWLLGWPQRVIEAQGLDVVLPVAGLVSQLEPGRQFRWLDRPNHHARMMPDDLEGQRDRTLDGRGVDDATDEPDVGTALSASSRMSSPRSSSCSLITSGNNKRMTLS